MSAIKTFLGIFIFITSWGSANAGLITVLDGQTLEIEFESPYSPNQFIEQQLKIANVLQLSIPVAAPVPGRTWPLNSQESEVTIKLYDGGWRLGTKETKFLYATFTDRNNEYSSSSNPLYSSVGVNFSSIQDGSIEGRFAITTNTPGSGYTINTDDVRIWTGISNDTGFTSYWDPQSVITDIDVTGKARPHQVLFLNFDNDLAGLSFDPLVRLTQTNNTAAFVYRQDEYVAPTEFRMPSESSAAASSRLKNYITALVAAEFREYGVEVVNQRPSTGEYSTIYMSRENLNSFKFLDGKVGFAEQMDTYKNDLSDNAIVMLDRVQAQSFVTDSDSYAAAVARTVSHEAGHLLGLAHVIDSSGKEIMIGSISNVDGDFRDRDLRVVAGEQENAGWFQNSDCSIRRSLELDVPSGCPNGLGEILNFFSLGLSSIPVYELGLGLVFDDDAFATFVEIGDLLIGETLTLDIPAGIQSVYLAGKSEKGGEYDILASPLGSALLSDVRPEDFLFSRSMSTEEISFYKIQNQAGVLLGGAVLERLSVPEPGSLALLLIGLTVFVPIRKICKAA